MAVVTTLRRSKAAVCSLLESDYMARLAAHPRREYRRKENNRSQNAERNAQVFVGRHAIGTGQVQVGMTGDLQDRDGNVVAAAAADHSGLIEQTRKLGAMGRRDAAAKRAKGASGTAIVVANKTDDNDSSEQNTAAAAAPNNDSAGPSIRKPRNRQRRPAAKAKALHIVAEMAGMEPVESTAGTTATAAAVETTCQQQEKQEQFRVADNSGKAAQLLLSPLLPSVATTDHSTRSSELPTSLPWSASDSTMTTAVATPTTPSASLEWPLAFEHLQPALAGHTAAADGTSVFGNDSLFTAGSGSMVPSKFPFTYNSFDLLSADAGLYPFNVGGRDTTCALPFHSTHSGGGSGYVFSNTDRNGPPQTEASDMVHDVPMEDAINVGGPVRSGNCGSSSNGNSTENNQNGQIAAPIQQMAVEQTTMSPTTPQWGTEEHMNLIYQLSLYGNGRYDAGAEGHWQGVAAVPAQAQGYMTMPTPDADLWAMRFDGDFVDLQADDGSSNMVENGTAYGGDAARSDNSVAASAGADVGVTDMNLFAWADDTSPAAILATGPEH